MRLCWNLIFNRADTMSFSLQKLLNAIKKLVSSVGLVPLALLGLALLVYGPLLPQLGAYWDDWVFAWTRANLGLKGLLDLFEMTRPIRGWIEMALTPLFGVSPFRWQAYALLMRTLAAFWFWWFLQQLWPGRRVGALIAAGVLMVYPGYTQQAQAMTYHYYWTFLGALFLSFGLMVRALRQGGRVNWWMYALSVVLCGLQLASMEYLLGLEILRPALLWLALVRIYPNLKTRLKYVALLEIPFALALAVYLYWRFFLYSHSIYSPVLLEEANISPLNTLSGLLGTTLNAIQLVLVQGWVQIFQLPVAGQFSGALGWVYVLVVLVILVGWPFVLHRYDDEPARQRHWDWVLLGLGGMLVAGLPFFIAGLPIRITFPENRVTLPFMPLVGMFVAGALSLVPGRSRQFLLAGLLMALAAGFQLQTASAYRDQFKQTRSFFWQLAWRAPKILPGTRILAQDDTTFQFDDGEALGIVLNWMYAGDPAAQPLPYQYLMLSTEADATLEGMLAAEKPALALVLRYSDTSCLHVLDPRYDGWLSSLTQEADIRQAAAMRLPLVPKNTLRALGLSNPAGVIADSGAPGWVMPSLLGAEPAHGWCYTYQKADLARQQGDWQAVAHLGDLAFAVPVLPDDDYEYLPFIEAYTRLGRVKDARLLTRQVLQDMPLLRPALCAIWMRAEEQATLAAATAAEMKSELQVCPVQLYDH